MDFDRSALIDSTNMMVSSSASFFAIIVAAYTFKLRLLQEEEEKDTSLKEINDQLRIDFGRIFLIFSVTSAVVLCVSFVALFLPSRYVYAFDFLSRTTLLFGFSSLLYGVVFAYALVNPKQLHLASLEIKAQDQRGRTADREVEAIDYLAKFIELEALIRQYAESPEAELDTLRISKTPHLSLREIFRILHMREQIDDDLHEKLLHVSKYRNLAVHGKIEKIGSKTMTLLESALEKMRKILKKD